MLIAIVALGLVVAYMASRPTDQQGPSQQGLPPDTNIPSQGTSGVPSPAPAQMDTPITTTQRGLLALGTNAGFLSYKYGPNKIRADIPTNVVSSTPQGPPDQSKSLDTNDTATKLTVFTSPPTGYRKL